MVFKFFSISNSFFIVGRGRTAALMAGPNPKKRKLNDISNSVKELSDDEAGNQLKAENENLKKAVASYQAKIALMGVRG